MRRKGIFLHSYSIDYDWMPGTYYLRAYTRLMMNFGAAAIPVCPLEVGKEWFASKETAYDLRCRMAVVGKCLLNGCIQRLAVCLQDDRELPVALQFHLMNERGDTITTATTSRNGLALLHFIPQHGCRYFLSTPYGDRFFLPETVDGGCQVHGDLKGNRISYRIRGETDMDGFRLWTYDRLNGLVEYETGGKASGVLFVENTPEVASLLLTNNQGKLISESTLYGPEFRDRLFPQWADMVQPGDTLHYVLPRTVEGQRVFARVVPDHVSALPMEASLRYVADYASVLPFPTDIFSSPDAEYRNDLYIWLCSATLKRFDLMEIIRKGDGIYRYMPEEVMVLNGTVTEADGKPLVGGRMVAYHTTKNLVYDAAVDDKGRFSVAVDDFQEGENFYLQGQSAKGKLEFYTYKMDKDTFPAVYNVSRTSSLKWQYSASSGRNDEMKEWTDADGDRHFQMPEVEVKARLRTSLPKSTNGFYGVDYVDRKRIRDKDYHSLQDVLRSMPGVRITQVVDDEGVVSYELTTNRGSSLLKGSTLMVLIDGVRMDDNKNVESILNMPAFEIESVELLRPWQANMYVSGAIDGCINIKTVQMSHLDKKEKVESKGVYYTPLGLSGGGGRKQPDPSPWISDRPGNYKLLLDVVTDTDVRSFVCPFKVAADDGHGR